jgi:ParB family chromosome partitioning protein
MRRALGKGLSQLLGDDGDPAATITQVDLDSIVPNARQPRRRFDEDTLDELASSIKEFGVIQPLIVRPVGENRYELVAGERRWRASRKAGLKQVPVIVRTASAQVSLELAIIENVQREDISAMDCAVAYRRLMSEFDLSQEQVAQKVGKSRAAVANTLRLLKLPDEMQEALAEGLLTEGHARALLMVDSPPRQSALFERVIRDGLSVREAERLARGGSEARPPSARGDKKVSPAAEARRDPNLGALEQGLSEYFGSPVRITRAEVGGKLTIDFYSDDDLQRILDILGVHL